MLKDSKCWWGCEEIGIILYGWWDYKLEYTLWKMVWRFLKKLKVELPYDPVISLLGIYPKKTKRLTQKVSVYIVHTKGLWGCGGAHRVGWLPKINVCNPRTTPGMLDNTFRLDMNELDSMPRRATRMEKWLEGATWGMSEGLGQEKPKDE